MVKTNRDTRSGNNILYMKFFKNYKEKSEKSQKSGEKFKNTT